MKVGLVLGGGGARGLAHIGVIRALEEEDIQASAISGCSMGAIIGAFYSIGKRAAEMEDIIKTLKYSSFLRFGKFGGLIGGEGIEELLAEHLPETFEALPIPLTMTAVDVQAGSLVILRQGQLIPALRASSALPGLISPVHSKGRYLIDGGLLNNLPVDIIKTMTLDPVIAVDVAAPHDRQLEFETEKRSMLESMSALFQGKLNILDEVFSRGLTIELFMKAFDVPQRVLTEMRLSMQPPEILIRPRINKQFGVEDFQRAEEAIERGYQAAQEALAQFRHAAK